MVVGCLESKVTTERSGAQGICECRLLMMLPNARRVSMQWCSKASLSFSIFSDKRGDLPGGVRKVTGKPQAPHHNSSQLNCGCHEPRRTDLNSRSSGLEHLGLPSCNTPIHCDWPTFTFTFSSASKNIQQWRQNSYPASCVSQRPHAPHSHPLPQNSQRPPHLSSAANSPQHQSHAQPTVKSSAAHGNNKKRAERPRPRSSTIRS